MHKHHIRMLIGCVLIMGAVLLLPRFGYGAASGSLLFGLLMLVCCVGPMLLMLLKRDPKSDVAGEEGGKAAAPGRKPPRSGACH